MEAILERLEKLENETSILKNELKKEREINRVLQLQISEMNEQNSSFEEYKVQLNKYNEICQNDKEETRCVISQLSSLVHSALHCEISVGSYDYYICNNNINHEVKLPLNIEYLHIHYCPKNIIYRGTCTKNDIYISSLNKLHMTQLKLLKKIEFTVESTDNSNGQNWINGSSHFDFEIFNNGVIESLTITGYMYPEKVFNSIQKINTLKELTFKQSFNYNRFIPPQEEYRRYCTENNIVLIIQ